MRGKERTLSVGERDGEREERGRELGPSKVQAWEGRKGDLSGPAIGES